MLRKIKLGQLKGAGLSGLGLGKIIPEVRVMELPLLLQSYSEADYLVKVMTPGFEKLFEERGYKLLGWAEQGFIYVFTNKEIKKLEDFRGIKMWVWSVDPLADAIFKELSDYVTPIPLGVPEVMTGLQAGLVNAFYNSPIGAVALQWYTKIKYLINVPFTYGTGAIILDKKVYDKIPDDVKKIIKEASDIYFAKIKETGRKEGEESLKGLKEYGVKFIDVPESGLTEIKTKMENVYKKMTGTLYPREILETAINTVKKYREDKGMK